MRWALKQSERPKQSEGRSQCVTRRSLKTEEKTQMPVWADASESLFRRARPVNFWIVGSGSDPYPALSAETVKDYAESARFEG